MAGTTTILVTDLASSTEMLLSGGDDQGTAALTEHLRLMRATVERHDGRVAKTLGDGVMALFDSAYQAVRAGVAVQQEADRAARRDGTSGAVRVGCNVGEVVVDEAAHSEDVFGGAVVLAHRICAQARPGEILVSAVVRALVGTRRDVAFEPVPAATLKGFAEPVELARVAWTPLPDATPCRVIVADDATLVRSGVVRLLAEEGFEVIGEASDADELLALIARDPPDLVVTDIRMPPTQTDEGLRAAAQIRERHPAVAVLVLSQHVQARAAADLLDDHAAGVGYLLKERVGELDEFIAAARSVAAGGRVVDPLVAEQLMHGGHDGDPVERLTERERDVLGLMAQGRSNAAIASELAMSPKTVESHVRAIFMKLDLAENPDDHRRVAAVVRWLERTRSQ
jgi:DNA-binding NarL/FixJ family response regulator/class 3 adenylate cyclase